MPSAHAVTLTVNGTTYTREIQPTLLLVEFLRETLGLTGTHVGCDTSQCGACTVRVDGLAKMDRSREQQQQEQETRSRSNGNGTASKSRTKATSAKASPKRATTRKRTMAKTAKKSTARSRSKRSRG